MENTSFSRDMITRLCQIHVPFRLVYFRIRLSRLISEDLFLGYDFVTVKNRVEIGYFMLFNFVNFLFTRILIGDNKSCTWCMSNFSYDFH